MESCPDHRLSCHYLRLTPLRLKRYHVILVNSSMLDLIITALIYSVLLGHVIN